MGCDIHIYTEVKKSTNNKMMWITSDNYTKNQYYGEDDCENEWQVNEIYNNRCYDLFAVLADVKNGYGFAGCNTGEGFKPISSPKGLPSDTCKEIKKESEDWDGDGHSHSYFTLKELKDYDLSQCTFKVGVVQLDKYIEYTKTNSAPDGWCGGISGPDIIVLQPDEVDGLVKDSKKQYYVQMKWPVAYSDVMGANFKQITKSLEEIKDGWRFGVESEDDIRIVFWFDN